MPNTLNATPLATEGPPNGVAPALVTRAPLTGQFIGATALPQVSGAVALNLPVAYTVQTEEVTKAISYADQMYNRIRYLPAAINLGALVSGQTQDLVVWNQHYTTQVLTALGLVNGAGVTVTGPTSNFAHAENSYQTYTITVDAEGPSVVDAQLVFDWATVPDYSLPIVGTRVVPFPFLYSKGAKESLTWQTRVLTSNNGSEQRIRVRRSPRQSFSVRAFVPFHLHNMAESLLFGWRDNHWGVPVFPEQRTLNAGTIVGSSTVNVDTANGQFVEGGIGIIYNSPTDYEIIQIMAVTSTTITTVSPLTKVFTANAICCPVLSCRMVSSPTRQTTGFGSVIMAEFEAIKNSVVPSAASPVQFLGEDVFLDEQLSIEDGVKDVYTSRVDKLDYASGNVGTFAPWDNPKKSRTFGLQFDDTEELYDFRTWLHRRAGRLRPFWVPTHEVNLKFVGTGPVNTELLVKDEGQFAYGQNRTHIMVVSGEDKILTTITNMTAANGIITLAIDVDLNRAYSDLSHGEYIGLNRLASDRIEISHGSNFDSYVSVPIIEVSP